MSNFRKYIFLLLPAFALILGGSIYMYLRPSEHVFFNWIRIIGLENLLSPGKLPSNSLNFPDWFIYSLPNGLWAFAYASLITWIWAGSKSWIRIPWMVSVPLIVFGFEIFQYFNIIRGTACWQDLVAGLLGICLGVYLGIVANKLTKTSTQNENSID